MKLNHHEFTAHLKNRHEQEKLYATQLLRQLGISSSRRLINTVVTIARSSFHILPR